MWTNFYLIFLLVSVWLSSFFKPSDSKPFSYPPTDAHSPDILTPADSPDIHTPAHSPDILTPAHSPDILPPLPQPEAQEYFLTDDLIRDHDVLEK